MIIDKSLSLRCTESLPFSKKTKGALGVFFFFTIINIIFVFVFGFN